MPAVVVDSRDIKPTFYSFLSFVVNFFCVSHRNEQILLFYVKYRGK